MKKGNPFSLPFFLQVLLLALAPGHAFHHAQLSRLTQQHRPRHCCLWAPLWISWLMRTRFSLHCWRLVSAACPEHRMATGVNLYTTHLPECKILLPALCAIPGWQGNVTAPSSAPQAGKAPVTLLKPPEAEAALRLLSNTSSIQSSAAELGNTRRAWKTSSCVIRHSSSGMRAHNSTRVSSTGFKGTHALKFPADSGLFFALPSQPQPEALKAFQANPGVPLGLVALVCTCAVLCGCSWERDGGILAVY